MYNEQDYDSMTRAANPDHPVHPASRKRKHRKNRFMRLRLSIKTRLLVLRLFMTVEIR